MEKEGLALYSNAMLAEVQTLFVPPVSTQSSSVTVLPVAGPSDQSASLPAGLQDLRDVVSAISNHSPLQLAPSLEAVIERAAQAHGTPADVEAWARRLAEDVRDLTD